MLGCKPVETPIQSNQKFKEETKEGLIDKGEISKIGKETDIFLSNKT